MTKRILLAIIIISFSGSCFGQFNKNQTYDELQALALDYFPDKADSTIIIMEFAYENFPDEFLNSSTILAQVYIRVDEFSKAIDIWNAGINRGYAYGLDNKIYQQYFKDNSEFNKLVEKEGNLLATMHMKHEVLLPHSYNKKKSYPVLYIFHGNSRNIEKSKLNWKASVLKKEFITVFLQSYLPASSADFRWVTNDDKTRKEFQNIYNQIQKEYSVDNSNIVFAGMSAGGWIALEFMMNNYFPASSLVLNCPVIPTDINDDMIISFVDQNRKLAIITGENDFALEDQKDLVSKIIKQNGQAIIEVNRGLGHDFSKDFTDHLEKNLRWVINK